MADDWMEGDNIQMEQECQRLKDEVEYWKRVAAYLAQCHAATAEYDGSLKSVSKARCKRFQDICATAAEALRGNFQDDRKSLVPRGIDDEIKSAMERCEKAAKEG